MTRVPEFQSAKWNEPIVMEMGRAGARGQLFPAPEDEVKKAVGTDLIPAAMQRKDASCADMINSNEKFTPSQSVNSPS